jgi:hypothetical protein
MKGKKRTESFLLLPHHWATLGIQPEQDLNLHLVISSEVTDLYAIYEKEQSKSEIFALYH